MRESLQLLRFQIEDRIRSGSGRTTRDAHAEIVSLAKAFPDRIRGRNVILFGEAGEADVLRKHGAANVTVFASSDQEYTREHPVRPAWAALFEAPVEPVPIGAVIFSVHGEAWRRNGQIQGILRRLEPSLARDALVMKLGNGKVRSVLIDWRRLLVDGFFGTMTAGRRAIEVISAHAGRLDDDWKTDSHEKVLEDWFDAGLIGTSGLAVEFGCGRGVNAAYMARRGWRVRATDLSPGAIFLARKRAARLEPAVRDRLGFQEGSLFAFTLQPQSVGLVFDRGCFHSIPSRARRRYLDLLFESLAPGGLFLLIVFSEFAVGGTNVAAFGLDELDRIFGPGFERIESRRVPYTRGEDSGLAVLMRRRALDRAPQWPDDEALDRFGFGLAPGPGGAGPALTPAAS